MGIKDLLGKSKGRASGHTLKADGSVETEVKDGPLPVIRFEDMKDAEENLEDVLDVVSPESSDDDGDA